MPSPLSGFCRVTLSAPTTRVDLAVPSGVPVATFLPVLLARLGSAGEVGSSGWSLRSVDGRALDVGATLDGNGVRDGDVLVVQPANSPVDPPLFDDVVELVGREAVRDRWTADDRRLLAAVAAVLAGLIALAGLAFSAGRRAPRLEAPGLGLAAAMVLLLAGFAFGRVLHDRAAGVVTASMAGPFAALGAALFVSGGDEGLRLLVGCGALLLVASVLPLVAADAVAGGYAIAALLAAVGGVLTLAGAGDVTRVAAAVGPLAIAVPSVLPSLALRLARVPRPATTSGEDADADPDDLDQACVLARVTAARALLTGATAGAAAIAVAGCVVLALSANAAARGLAVVLAALVLSRSRLYAARGHVLVVASAGVVSVAAVAVTALLTWRGAAVFIGVGAAAAVTVAAFVALAAGRWRSSPRQRRLVDVAEALALAAVVPLALAVWNAYAAVRLQV